MKKGVYLLITVLIFSSCKQSEKQKETEKPESKPEQIEIKKETVNSDSIKKHDTFNEAIAVAADNLKTFIPKDYEAINVAKGDLNLDEFNDVILVLRKSTEETTSNYNENKPDKRPLLILLGQKNNTYKLAFKNDNAVYCIDCGGVFGDPFTGISIKKGFFSIEHGISGGHHWENISTFKYNKAKENWFLYKDHYLNYVLNSDTSDNAEALVVDVDKLKTVKDFGEISFQNFNIYNEEGY
ncbi:hypothetical protein EV144_101888 [Flavobacterium sp. 270]|uniref:hypothetical protein n=1 Tax=Flavobacterium sp. 270 TaxID=2512114 RepID=UPI001064FDB1|nr:hypothetical protein [Flavobacterium sp. 270]TDW52200.1 hypothetical protein EV144_101888 [Flavobacterium sp. 270]